MTAAELAGRLEHAKPKKFRQGDGFTARCPSCAAQGKDKSGTNFSVHERQDGWLHVFCQTGCDEHAIMASLGLRDEDRRIIPYAPATELSSIGRPHPVYTYEGLKPFTAHDGYIAEKHRFPPKEPDGRKSFVWKVRFRDGQPIAKVKKVAQKTKREYEDYPTVSDLGMEVETEVVYRLPQVRRAIDAGKPIVLVESEKATDLSWEKGIPCTNQGYGAGSGKWRQPHTDQLRGAREIIIVADRDKPGEAYASEVFVLLRAARYKARVFRPKTTGDGDGWEDHLEAGYGIADLVAAPDLMPPRGLQLTQFGDDFEPIEARHLVYPYLQRGKCILLDADSGTGKTSMAAAWAASITLGLHPTTHEPLPDGPQKVLYLHHGEDQSEEVHTVFLANGGSPKMIAYTGKGIHFDAKGLALVEETIEDFGAKLVIVDALFYFLAGIVKDTAVAMDALPVMEKLNDIAARTDVTFFNIRHTVKGIVNKRASDLGMGSPAFRNSHRGQLVARFHPKKPGVVVVEDLKGSLLNERGETFYYRRVGNEIQYLMDCYNPFETKSEADDSVTKLDAAQNLLRTMLTGHWVQHSEVYKAAKIKGISVKTLERARGLLNVESKRLFAEGGYMLYIRTDESDQSEFDEFD